VTEVAAGMGYDERIGHHFLYAGLGYGGSCFPKDVEALAYMAEEMNQPHKILDAVMHVNASRMDRAVDRLKDHFGDDLKGKTIGLLGLTFKPNTDDMRYAPSIGIAHELDKLGATVKGFDPVGMDVAAPLMPMVKMVESAYEVATDCDAVVLCTEWNEFRNLDVAKMRDLMKSAVLFDGRNVFDPQMMRDAGYVYFGVGRGYDPVI
jgi:UDPglucose 6-dehydrogenase